MPLAIAPLSSDDHHPAPCGPGARERRRCNEIIITGRHPLTKKTVSREMYMQAVLNAKHTDAPVCQLAAQVCAAACSALRNSGGTPRDRFYADGTVKDWGLMVRTGADTMLAMEHALPPMAMPPLTESYGNCTRKEIAAVLAMARGRTNASLQCITPAHRQPRAKVLAAATLPPNPVFVSVWTPQEVIAQDAYFRTTHDPHIQFLTDVIRAAEPPKEVDRYERLWETIVLRPLSRLPRVESWLADRFRGTPYTDANLDDIELMSRSTLVRTYVGT